MKEKSQHQINFTKVPVKVNSRKLDPNWKIDVYGDVYYAQTLRLLEIHENHNETRYVVEIWSEKAQEWVKSRDRSEWHYNIGSGRWTVSSKLYTWLNMNNWS